MASKQALNSHKETIEMLICEQEEESWTFSNELLKMMILQLEQGEQQYV